jgi:hypothetical protein
MAAKARALSVPTLLERIEALQEEINDIIDSRIDDLAKATLGVPKGILRAMLLHKGNGCLCAAYKAMKEEH